MESEGFNSALDSLLPTGLCFPSMCRVEQEGCFSATGPNLLPYFKMCSETCLISAYL